MIVVLKQWKYIYSVSLVWTISLIQADFWKVEYRAVQISEDQMYYTQYMYTASYNDHVIYSNRIVNVHTSSCTLLTSYTLIE